MSLRHALLGLLADHPASGYDLLKRFDTSLAFVWPATQSQLYGELKRLADAGLIEAAATGPRRRTDYAITEAGRAELAHWLTEVEPEHSRRNDALLRVFFLWTVDPARAVEYLEREARLYRQFGEALRQVADTVAWDESGFDRCARLALENGLRVSEANAAWAEWAAGEVAGDTDG